MSVTKSAQIQHHQRVAGRSKTRNANFLFVCVSIAELMLLDSIKLKSVPPNSKAKTKWKERKKISGDFGFAHKILRLLGSFFYTLNKISCLWNFSEFLFHIFVEPAEK